MKPIQTNKRNEKYDSDPTPQTIIMASAHNTTPKTKFDPITLLKAKAPDNNFAQILLGIVDMLGDVTYTDQVKLDAVNARMNGDRFSMEEHLKAIVYSLFSAQKKWKDVLPKLPTIDEIFCNYSIPAIRAKGAERILEEIFAKRCGSRSTQQQMGKLEEILRTLECHHDALERDFARLEHYAERIVPWIRTLAVSPRDKFPMMGPALLALYFQWIGIPIMKIDVHLGRICGSTRLGLMPSYSIPEKATNAMTLRGLEELLGAAREISENPRFFIWVDDVFWSFGERSYCKKQPACSQCSNQNYCNYIK